MPLSDKERAFIEQRRPAAMITVKADGSPHAVRVGVTLVDGKLWSSGTRGRARTAFVRRDPRAVLFFWDEGYGYLSLETRVRILDDADVPQNSLRLFQAMQAHMDNAPGTVRWNGKPVTVAEFLQTMVDEQRVIYEFEVERSYGLL